jgi:addiction module HigA family antidote
VTEITKFSRSLTAETALRLAEYLENSAAFWIGLQAEHDLEVTERSVGAKIKREVVTLAL